MLKRLLYSQLPTWGRPTHPVMRSTLGNIRRMSWLRRLLYLLVMIGACVLAVVLGYLVARENLLDFIIQGRPMDEPTARAILYYPLIAAQTIALLLAVALTANVIALEKQKQTWETLKVSTVGVKLTLRARWLSVYFRLWGLLVAITLGRLVYVGYLMNDMTEFQGRSLDLYISTINTDVSLDSAILIVTAHMTAFILLPFIEVGLGAALGLLLAVVTRTRSIVILGLLLLLGLRLAITISALQVGGTLFGADGLLSEVFRLSNDEAWVRLLYFSIEGDMGLMLMNLETLGQIWADVEDGIYLGVAMLGIVLAQALFANILVLLVAHWAARPETEVKLSAWWTISGIVIGALIGVVGANVLGGTGYVVTAATGVMALVGAIIMGIIVDTTIRPWRYRQLQTQTTLASS